MTINLTDLMGGGVRVIDAQILTASGDWIKPAAGLPNDDVFIQIFGGGGGGWNQASSGAGGGGGGYGEFRCKLRDLPSVVAAVVGAGGVPASDGGASLFGVLRCNGGGTGTSTTGGAPGSTSGDFDRSFPGGAGSRVSSAPDAIAPCGGTSYTHAPGKSLLGGDGGAANVPGSIPGGGGGVQAAGARGEIRVFVTRG
jgi:hypothetical protein